MEDSSKNKFAKDIWNFFASMQLSVVTILFLAVTSIFGTVIHQSTDAAHNLEHYGPFLFQFFDTLGLFNVYHSLWYQAAFLILAVNLIVCSVDKLSSTWKIIFKKDITSSLSQFENKKNNIILNLKGDVDAGIEKIVRKFSKNYKVEKDGKRTTFFAEKGRKTRLGVYVVHISILFMIAGGAIGMKYGFKGFVNIPEGSSVKSALSRDRTERLNFGFELKCTDFNVTHYKGSKMASEYRSDLVILKNGEEVLKKRIIVNDPLRYEGISFYQSSFGEMGTPTEMTAVFKSVETGLEYSKRMKIGDTYVIPEGLGTFTLTKYGNYSFRGQPLGNSLFGTIKRDGEKKPIGIVVPLKFLEFDMMRNKMKKGKVFVTFKDFKRSYYTGLQVTKDPGVWWVYTGFILLVLGCYVTFFMSHKTICVSITKNSDKNVVMVSGSANKNRQGMKFWLERFAAGIEKEFKN